MSILSLCAFISHGLLILAVLATGTAMVMLKEETASMHWLAYSDTALAEAQQSGRPILLEFTADWCINCKVLENTVYSHPDVIEAARDVNLLLLRVDMTDFNAGHKQLLERHGGLVLCPMRSSSIARATLSKHIPACSASSHCWIR